MRSWQRSFVETGAASSVLSLIEKNIGLGVGSQQELVPLQREILVAEINRRNEKKREQQEAAKKGKTNGRVPNSQSNKRTESVKYINDSERD